MIVADRLRDKASPPGGTMTLCAGVEVNGAIAK